jgi:hypothetical protein
MLRPPASHGKATAPDRTRRGTRPAPFCIPLLLIGDETLSSTTPSIGPTPPVFDNNHFVHFIWSSLLGLIVYKGESLLTEGM